MRCVLFRVRERESVGKTSKSVSAPKAFMATQGVGIPALPLSICVTLGMLLKL